MTSDQPLVSVVVPTHRGDLYLPEALQSVLGQSHQNWELLVVDDCPESPAAGVVAGIVERSRGRRVQYLKTPGLGPAAARNRGIAESRGSHIALLDEDDLWKDTHLRAALRALQIASAELAFSPVEMFEHGTNEPRGLWGPTREEVDSFPVSLYLRNYIGVLSVVFLKKVTARHGVFDPNPRLRYGEDHDYWVRLAFEGVRFVQTEGIHGRYRKGHASGTSDTYRLMEVHGRVYRRHLRAALSKASLPRALRAAIAARHAELAVHPAARTGGRVLFYSFWTLWISPEKGQVLRSGIRRLREALRAGPS